MRKRCHASCCFGETDLDDLDGTCHHMQAILDGLGYPSGCFGDRHLSVLEAMREAYREGARTMQRINIAYDWREP